MVGTSQHRPAANAVSAYEKVAGETVPNIEYRGGDECIEKRTFKLAFNLMF